MGMYDFAILAILVIFAGFIRLLWWWEKVGAPRARARAAEQWEAQMAPIRAAEAAREAEEMQRRLHEQQERRRAKEEAARQEAAEAARREAQQWELSKSMERTRQFLEAERLEALRQEYLRKADTRGHRLNIPWRRPI